jgi:hypothetical protein
MEADAWPANGESMTHIAGSIHATLVAAAPAVIGTRVAAIGIGLGLWYLTQWLLARREQKLPASEASGYIRDGIHELTAPIHRKLLANPRLADALLFASSLVIDLVGFYLLGSAIFGVTIRPFLGLLMLFGLRQICQAFCPLPPPDGMIWRSPGFPTILVTYGTSNDLFFSGHTALAVYGAACLATTFGPIGIALGISIAIFEIITVLVLRAHYTMDVFTGIIAALYVNHLAWQFSSSVDQWIATVIGWF